ncbi:MAG: DUF3048 domain-containing protein [Chloroflexota bacterium]
MQRSKALVHRFIFAAIALILVGCGADETESIPTMTQGKEPPAETLEASPTATLIPTFTPVPSPTPAPNNPAATSLPTPEGMIGPDEFPDGVNPLTGLEVSDAETLLRRPVSVKISNSPAQYVRPQSGLSKADLVFEHYAEGGVTRLTAVYYSNVLSQVGSVRSARIIDLEIPAMYQSAFAFSGASAGVKQLIRESDFFTRSISPDFGYGEPYFYRVPREGVPLEHTLFADLYDIWAWMDNREINQPVKLRGMGFSEIVPESDSNAKRVHVNYIAGESQVTWIYSPASGNYQRWQGGMTHTDSQSGAQLTASNVVVVYAHHQDTDILEDHVGGGHYSIQIQIWGEGRAQLFRDGKLYEGRWRRSERHDMLSFVDDQGVTLPLKPGNTWFQLVPIDFDRATVES